MIGNGVDLLAVHQVCAQVSRTLQHLSGGPALEINPVIFPSSDWDHPQPDSLAERLKTTGQLVDVNRPVEFAPAEPLPLNRAVKAMSVSRP